MNYCDNILSPSDWKLPNPTDFIDVVKKKMKPSRFYSERLRHLAATCNFGEFLNRSLRGQFVFGTETCKKLLSED